MVRKWDYVNVTNASVCEIHIQYTLSKDSEWMASYFSSCKIL